MYTGSKVLLDEVRGAASKADIAEKVKEHDEKEGAHRVLVDRNAAFRPA